MWIISALLVFHPGSEKYKIDWLKKQIDFIFFIGDTMFLIPFK